MSDSKTKNFTKNEIKEMKIYDAKVRLRKDALQLSLDRNRQRDEDKVEISVITKEADALYEWLIAKM